MDFSNLDLDSDALDAMLADHDPDDDDKESLDASENSLSRWPKLDRFASGLRFLSLACNRLSKASEVDLPSLSFLHLFKNAFEEVCFCLLFL